MSLLLVACGGPPEAEGHAAGVPDGADAVGDRLALTALPDPCEWLSAAEAQELLGLDQPPRHHAMGSPDAAGRSCIYTTADESRWLNVGYQGLNPQVLDPEGRSTQELIALAQTAFAYGLEHVESTTTGGRPTLAFGNEERSLVVVFSGIGKARDLPEGISERHAISSWIQPVLGMAHPGRTQGERIAVLIELADRAVAQLAGVASSGS